MAVAGPMALEVALWFATFTWQELPSVGGAVVCHLHMAELAICRWLAVPSDTYHMTYITSTDQRVASVLHS